MELFFPYLQLVFGPTLYISLDVYGKLVGTLSPIIMEVENGGLENDWLVSFRGPFSTSMIMGGRVNTTYMVSEQFIINP